MALNPEYASNKTPIKKNRSAKRVTMKAFFEAASALFLFTSLAALSMTDFPLTTQEAPPVAIAVELGRKLLDTGSGGYVLPFEIISLLLLVAVLGGIVVARGKRDDPEERMAEGKSS